MSSSGSPVAMPEPCVILVVRIGSGRHGVIWLPFFAALVSCGGGWFVSLVWWWWRRGGGGGQRGAHQSAWLCACSLATGVPVSLNSRWPGSGLHAARFRGTPSFNVCPLREGGGAWAGAAVGRVAWLSLASCHPLPAAFRGPLACDQDGGYASSFSLAPVPATLPERLCRVVVASGGCCQWGRCRVVVVLLCSRS